MKPSNAGALSLMCALALSACQSPSLRVVQTPQVQIPPLPAAIGTKRAPNLRLRLEQLLQPSPTTATTPSGS